ncbi:hypothetical protein ACN2XU_17950 [Primorskyibacter sp. 2E107]|uniref:hypothetical protein n=1 Tax=Primorskyibacter sp. 2E107 TaxID=3403458 RepID=UPI003AF471D2
MVESEPQLLKPDVLARLRSRFPHLDESAVADFAPDQTRLSRHLAERHDLTMLEAHEELQDFLGLERLSAHVAQVASR